MRRETWQIPPSSEANEPSCVAKQSALPRLCRSTTATSMRVRPPREVLARRAPASPLPPRREALLAGLVQTPRERRRIRQCSSLAHPSALQPGYHRTSRHGSAAIRPEWHCGKPYQAIRLKLVTDFQIRLFNVVRDRCRLTTAHPASQETPVHAADYGAPAMAGPSHLRDLALHRHPRDLIRGKPQKFIAAGAIGKEKLTLIRHREGAGRPRVPGAGRTGQYRRPL